MNSDECMIIIGKFLERLIEPRYDKDETNDYVNGSTDCKNAIEAYVEWRASNDTKL